MLGAIAGDIVGSVYEFNDNFKSKEFPLFVPESCFTDDTVHTVAVADAILNGLDFGETILRYTRKYQDRGYGARLTEWARSDDPTPYESYGNGSAMRVSPAGWWAKSLDEALELAERSAEPTHNHPEGIKGARATAAAVRLAREGAGPRDIAGEITRRFGYDLSATVDEIRSVYEYNETCQGTVPEAVVCALEAADLEDALRNAVSIGGDSDTLACIAGSIAEAMFGVPEEIAGEALARLDDDLTGVVLEFRAACEARAD